MILVVEDNDDIRRFIVRVLSQTYQVIEARDGVEALAQLCSCLPDLVLTDVMMPKLDGLGLLRQLRREPRTSAVPVVLLSALALTELNLDGLDERPNDYLMKPFNSQDLGALVRANLPHPQL